jgi:hypothetical protein
MTQALMQQKVAVVMGHEPGQEPGLGQTQGRQGQRLERHEGQDLGLIDE